MSDHSELKKLAEAATPGRWTAYDTHGRRFIEAIGTEDHVVCATPKKQWLKDSEYIAAADPVTVLALIAEVEQLKADLQGELSAAKEDARRQRADQIAYRAAVYLLNREAPGEVVGGARLQRLFLISNDNAQILLSAMKERGDLVEIKEKPWGGMVRSTNSEILGEQP